MLKTYKDKKILFFGSDVLGDSTPSTVVFYDTFDGATLDTDKWDLLEDHIQVDIYQANSRINFDLIGASTGSPRIQSKITYLETPVMCCIFDIEITNQNLVNNFYIGVRDLAVSPQNLMQLQRTATNNFLTAVIKIDGVNSFVDAELLDCTTKQTVKFLADGTNVSWHVWSGGAWVLKGSEAGVLTTGMYAYISYVGATFPNSLKSDSFYISTVDVAEQYPI